MFREEVEEDGALEVVASILLDVLREGVFFQVPEGAKVPPSGGQALILSLVDAAIFWRFGVDIL